MQSNPKIEKFIDAIKEQIRWDKAKDFATDEIRDHVIDQQEEFVSEGIENEYALDLAIREMGDPIEIGTELDRTHRPKSQWSMFILVGILLIIGFVVRQIASGDINNYQPVDRSIAATIIGTMMMFIAYYSDFTIIGKYPIGIYTGLTVITSLHYYFMHNYFGLWRGSVQFILLL